MKITNTWLFKTYRFNWYYGFTVILSLICYARTSENWQEVSSWQAWSWNSIYVYSSLFLFAASVVVSHCDKIEFGNAGLKSLRKQFIYAAHWIGILYLNSLAVVFFHEDILMLSKWMGITILFTSVVNSVPWFRDTLEAEYQIYEDWHLEDFFYFRGHFSKNKPKAGRNPIHAAWPILVCTVLAINTYACLSKNTTRIPIAKLVQDVGRIPASNLSGSKVENESGDLQERMGFQMVKGILLLSLAVTGLFVVYNHTLRTDYAKKWEILSKHQHNILELYSDKNIAAIKIAELQFAIDLIETNMWGHRSFNKMFNGIIVRYAEQEWMSKKTKIPRKKLLEALSEDLRGFLN